MGIFRKKAKSLKNSVDVELVEFNTNFFDSLIVLADDNKEIVTELKKLQEQIKYLIPSVTEEVLNMDKKIKNTLEDIRIILIKDNQSEKIAGALKDLKVLIADRNTKV